MPAFPQRASLCHLAPVIINQTPGVAKVKIVCQFCKEPCDFVPDFNLEPVNLELSLHRYKEGMQDFMETFDSIQEIAKRQYVETIDKISRSKYPRAVDK